MTGEPIQLRVHAGDSADATPAHGRAAHRPVGLIIALVVSNVVTLLVLAVCLTVLLVRGADSARTVAVDRDAAWREEAEQLRSMYLSALSNENAPQASSANGLDQWTFVASELFGEGSPNNRATVVSADGRVESLYRGDTFQGYVVERIEPQQLVLANAAGETRTMRRRRLEAATLPPIPFVDMNAWDGRPQVDDRPRGDRGDRGDRPAQDEGRSITLEDGTVVALPDGVDSFDPREYSEDERRAAEAGLPAGVELPEAPVAGTYQVAPSVVYDWVHEYQERLDELVLVAEYDRASAKYVGARLRFIPNDSPLLSYGFRQNDIVVEVNGRPVRTPQDLDRLPLLIDATNGVTVKVQRGGEVTAIRLTYSRGQYESYLELVAERAEEEQRRLAEARERAGLTTGDTAESDATSESRQN